MPERYEIVRKLGEGGIGVVYLARDTHVNDQLVALKRLPAEKTRDPQALSALRREVEAARPLRHPNIVGVHDLATDEKGDHLVVMEYVEGQTLKSLLADKGNLTPTEVIPIIEQIRGFSDIPISIDTIQGGSGALRYTESVVDLTTTLGGAPFAFTRRYDTLDAAQPGDFGTGWQWAGASPRITTNLPPTGDEANGVWPALRDDTHLYVNLPDGRRVRFTFVPVEHFLDGYTWYEPAWQAAAGVDYRLETPDAACNGSMARSISWGPACRTSRRAARSPERRTSAVPTSWHSRRVQYRCPWSWRASRTSSTSKGMSSLFIAVASLRARPVAGQRTGPLARPRPRVE